MSIWDFYYLLCGGLAGLLAGVLGIGGGLVLVPCLLILFTQQSIPTPESLAVGTAFAITAITTLGAAWGHYKQQAIHWPSWNAVVIPSCIGVIIANYGFRFVPPDYWHGAFSVVMLLAALLMLRPVELHALRTRIAWVDAIFGLFIGMIAGLFGIGGGILWVPFFLWQRLPLQQCIGTSVACVLPSALLGAGLSAWEDAVCWEAVGMGCIGSVLTVQIGVTFAHRYPNYVIRYLFVAVLMTYGLYTLTESFVTYLE